MKLSGLKVLDLSACLPGPHMAIMMGDHRAEVGVDRYVQAL
jgi:crotonobetainyl-CoA:carnitine CoA-transferase CaiB-like acyl-CoA transferase